MVWPCIGCSVRNSLWVFGALPRLWDFWALAFGAGRWAVAGGPLMFLFWTFPLGIGSAFLSFLIPLSLTLGMLIVPLRENQRTRQARSENDGAKRHRRADSERFIQEQQNQTKSSIIINGECGNPRLQTHFFPKNLITQAKTVIPLIFSQ